MRIRTHHLRVWRVGPRARFSLRVTVASVKRTIPVRKTRTSSAWTHPAFPTNRVWPPLESVATRVWSNRTLRYAAPRAALPSGATAAP